MLQLNIIRRCWTYLLKTIPLSIKASPMSHALWHHYYMYIRHGTCYHDVTCSIIHDITIVSNKVDATWYMPSLLYQKRYMLQLWCHMFLDTWHHLHKKRYMLQLWCHMFLYTWHHLHKKSRFRKLVTACDPATHSLIKQPQ